MADKAGYNDEDAEDTIFQRALALSLAPVQFLTSRIAIKAYLSTLLFLFSSTLLLIVSSTAYGFFYYNYIPQINLERVLYLQYGHGLYPHANAELDISALISQQAYDVELILDMPRTPKNLDAGNFMLDLSLLGIGINVKTVPAPVSSWLANITADNVLYHSRRPTILPYASPIVSLSHTVLHLPWHLLNLRNLDSSHLVVPMFEMLSFPRGSGNIPTHARLELQSTILLQVYSAKLAFRAKFQGLRYLVYNYRITAFVLFTTLFYSISVTSMALAWALISSFWGSSRPFELRPQQLKQEGEGNTPKTEQESESARKIKTEEDVESSTNQQRGSDDADIDIMTQQLGPDEAADDEDEEDDTQELRGRLFPADSGIGTSMESEHTGSGLVLRRNSRSLPGT